MFNFVSKRKWFFLASAIIILAGIIVMGVAGLNLGIEFSSGSSMTLVFQEQVEQADLRAALADMGHSQATIQRSAKDAFLLQGLTLKPDDLVDRLQTKFDTTIRLAEFEAAGNETAGNSTIALMFGKPIDQSELTSELEAIGLSGISIEQKTLDSFLVKTKSLSSDEQGQFEQTLNQKFGSLSLLDFYSISAVVASERVQYTSYAVVLAAVGILLYIAWAFRKLAHSFRFGVCAIIALVHDVLVLLAIFAMLRAQIDAMFIIAVLTVIGYGVNNIIVVFDRIRENRIRYPNADLETTVNIGLTETLTRSLNTSLTTLFALFALFAFGGATIHNFILALIIGIIVSTYSSIFIAGQLLVSWERGEFSWLYRWIPLRRKQQS